MRIVVIGGVAAGTSAAAQAKRREPSCEVILLERDGEVSYGACGIPYNLADPARDLNDLVAVSAQEFREKRKVDVRTGHEVTNLDLANKRVTVRDLSMSREYTLSYDKLVIATGAQAVRPKVPGLELHGVFVLRTLEDAHRIKQALAGRKATRAVLVGGGYIGMEMAETLRARNVAVQLIERSPQVLPGFEPAIAEIAQQELLLNRVNVATGVGLEAIERTSEGALVVRASEGKSYEADLVLVAVGVQPNVALAKAAGIRLGETGAIAVDAQQRTSAPDVFAAGDCAEARNLVSQRDVWIPLGPTANKQGKVAGANATGADERFGGIVGSAAFKVFDLEVGRTGLGAKDIETLKLEVVRATSKHGDHASSFSEPHDLTTILFVEKGSRRLLGAQMIGKGVVGKRIDVLATALHARMSVDDVEALDLSYAPPIAPVYDPVLIAATVARKELEKG